MDTLADYVQWMGEFSFSQADFREADALILCALSYFDFSPLFACGEESRLLREARGPAERGELKVMITGGSAGFPELLALCADSERFGSLRMSGYCDRYAQNPPLQFAALCFHDQGELSFLAYRGTDSTLAGWKEDCMISFTRTQAQTQALDYARRQLCPGRRWRLGGHSKGANLALYTACLLGEAQWETVERVYLLDGPGFCPEVLDPALTERIDSRTTQILPRFSIVGQLFAPRVTDTRIVDARHTGLMQHLLLSWGIDHGRLAAAVEHDPESLIYSQALNEWISAIHPDDRPVFVNELFDALEAGGAETLEELTAGGREGAEAVFRRLSGCSETTRRTLSDLPKFVMKVRLERLRQKLPSELAELGRREARAPRGGKAAGESLRKGDS